MIVISRGRLALLLAVMPALAAAVPPLPADEPPTSGPNASRAAGTVVIDKCQIKVFDRALLAADPGDPALGVLERRLQRRHLGRPAAVLGAGPRVLRVAGVLDLDLDAEAVLEELPRLQGLLEQDPGVDRHDADGVRGSLVELEQLVDQDGLLLLEGAQQHRPLAMTGGLTQGVGEAERDVRRCVHHRAP